METVRITDKGGKKNQWGHAPYHRVSWNITRFNTN